MRKKENAKQAEGHFSMNKSDKIFVAGHRGMVGSALVRRLESEGFTNLPKLDRSQLDLTNESTVAKFFKQEKPADVILVAAKVGRVKVDNGPAVGVLGD